MTHKTQRKIDENKKNAAEKINPGSFVYLKWYLSVLREDGKIKVVVVVGNGNLAGRIDADADGIVGDAYTEHKTIKQTKRIFFIKVRITRSLSNVEP